MIIIRSDLFLTIILTFDFIDIFTYFKNVFPLYFVDVVKIYTKCLEGNAIGSIDMNTGFRLISIAFVNVAGVLITLINCY